MKTIIFAVLALSVSTMLVGCGKGSGSKGSSSSNYSSVGTLTGAAASDYVLVRDALNAKDPAEGLANADQVRFINVGWTTSQKKFLFISYTSVTNSVTCEYALITKTSTNPIAVQAASTNNACTTASPSWSTMAPYDRTQDAYLSEFVNLTPSSISSVARTTAVINGQSLEAYKVIVTGYSTQTMYVVVPSLPVMANPVYKAVQNNNGSPIYHQLYGLQAVY